MTVEDSRKLLPPKFYPTWVLNWLNLHLDKVWPYVNEASSELIRSSVEPILEQYRPAVLSSLKFSKLTLGTVAPQFTGVSIVEGENENGGVTMELEMQWDGNPNIVLDIKTRVGVGLPIQVKNIGFTGVFRLIFKPLVDEFPSFGAVSFSLREKKKLDFTLKIVGGDISSIPGISDAIEETIRDAIEDSITWPVRKVIPIIPGDYSDLELKPVGTLEVKLVQAKELLNKDLIGKSDPFAVLFVRPLQARTKTSKTMNNQLNPVWNEHFEFIIEDASTQHLTVRVFDDEGIQASELIGCAQVPLKDLEPGKVKDVWLKLVKDLEIQRDNKYRGQVHLELLYCPFGVESSFKNPFDPGYSLTIFEKTLKSGADGTEAGDIATSSTRRKSNVIVRGTRVVNESLNPVWNQTFDFVVEDGLHDMLVLEVWDHDTFGKDKIGRVIMTLTRVILEGEFQDTFPLDGAKSGNITLHLKWSAQPKLRDSS
ncbi:synaptotagmin-5-like [Quillaja saponaria]|uniref:Synaptotagmin-5-like n=1 Tax=Quillaja saponaria TaxID=32244 RepID=A0AAD7PS53_QUISA|nr:synaptotagmin-5-like [Quillaja saponaria]